MTTMTCAELREVAYEVALDLLDGADRAGALAHLETCASCRHEVASLTEITEDLLLLAPAVEPSSGFAAGVLAQVQQLAHPQATVSQPVSASTPRRRMWARPARLLAAAAIVIALLVAVVVVRTGRDDGSVAAAADMRTATGQTVGSVSLADDDPTTLTVSVPGWVGLVHSYGASVDATYWLAVEHDDGTRALHPLAPDADYTWIVPLDVDPDAVASVSVLDDEGRQWCAARFDA
jgi:hypothetical protein